MNAILQGQDSNMPGDAMTVLAVSFRTREDLIAERRALLDSIGLSDEDLREGAASHTLTVSEYTVLEAIEDIDYLVND
jgi:hypothetical protein